MTREVTDQLYIDLEYFTPEQYYVYIAEAQAAVEAQATLVGDGDILGAPIEGAATLSAAFAVSSTAERTIEFNASITSEATSSITIGKLFDLIITTESLFNSNITAVATLSFVVDTSSTFEFVTINERNRAVDVILDSLANVDAMADRVAGFESSLLGEFTQASTEDRIRDFDSAQAAETTQTSDVNIIAFGSCDVGALFSPGLTIEVIKNTFAILDVVASLESTAVKLVEVQASLSSEFSQSTNAVKVTNITSAINSNIQVSAAVGKIASANSAITAFGSINLTARLWGNNRNPKIATAIGSPILTQTQSVFGNWSAYFPPSTATVFPFDHSYYEFDDSADWDFSASSNYTIDFRLRYESGGSASRDLFSQYNADETRYWRIILSSAGRITYSAVDSGGTLRSTQTTVGSMSPDTWYHIRIVGSTIWINGQRNVTGASIIHTNVAGKLNVGDYRSAVTGTRSTFGVYLDEVFIIKSALTSQSSTSFTVPTAEYVNADYVSPTASLLLHFNGNIYDDVTSPVIRQAQANLSSAFAQTVSAVKLIIADSQLSSAFTQQAAVTKEVNVSSSLNTQVNVIVAIDRFREVSSEQSAEFTQVIDAIRIRDVDLQQSAEFAQTIDANKIVGFSSDLSSEFNEQAQGNRIRFGASDLSANATLEATTTGTIDFIADLNSEFTQQATALRIKESTVSLSCEFTSSTQAQRIRSFDSATSTQAGLTSIVSVTRDAIISTEAVFSELTVVARIADFFVTCDVTAEVNAQANVLSNALATLTAEFTESVTGQKQVSAISNESSEFTLSSEGTTNITGEGDLVLASAMNLVASKFTGVQATLSSSTQQSTQVRRLAGLSLQASSVTQLTSNVGKVSQGQAAFNANSTLVFDGSIVVPAQAALTVSSSLLAQGKLLQLSDLRTYIIEPEIRVYEIEQEIRTLTI